MRSPCADGHRPGVGCPRLPPAPCARIARSTLLHCDRHAPQSANFSLHRVELQLVEALRRGPGFAEAAKQRRVHRRRPSPLAWIEHGTSV